MQGFLNNARQGLLRHHHLALAGAALMTIAQRWREWPIAINEAGLLTLLGLLSVLLPVMLGVERLHILKKAAIGIRAKSNRRAFQHCPAAFNSVARVQMHPNIPCQAGNIIYNHHIALFTVLFKEGQHLQNAFPIRPTARNAKVSENPVDGIALPVGVLGAVGGLGFDAHARLHLRLRGDADVNHGVF
ncbi:MAG: hypothetical protein VKJ06_09420 [Vampirovibrionales bacterium]|nr:hypothetical protein [Vampirovibrionales bacterium]